MENRSKTTITVETNINASIDKVWDSFTKPAHITKWNNASPDWHSPRAENDLREGGNFLYRMEATDGSMGFDFAGVYDRVKENELIEYTMGDGRRVQVKFSQGDDSTTVKESFEAEDTNAPEFQKAGWQAILDNFKTYTESLS